MAEIPKFSKNRSSDNGCHINGESQLENTTSHIQDMGFLPI